MSWNRPIYAEIAAGVGGDIEAFWLADSNLGDMREAPRFNQYYVLPDSFGLALDSDTAAPVFAAVLVPAEAPGATGTAAFRVRASFGLAPALDPVRVARIRDEKFSLQLASSLPYLVVYTPQLREYFAVEPVSHVNNALNMPSAEQHGVVTLPPGDAMSATMKLNIHEVHA